MMDLRDLGPGSVPLGMLRRYLTATGWHVRGSNPIDMGRLENAAARVLLNGRTGGRRNFHVYVSNVVDFDGVELVVPASADSSE
jgi:hypothetical protein